ncbi:class I SAM-dependent methyltransferase [Allorhodopirellula heiligendammensis]|uniref:THUMP-like domain-containing protein n=1 Tax=Allorhodopirellula heiligendammensis TaxID=2714739 RepID=A0A5C6BWI1_9BACT|nr:class I SAM-dependent methyltransferase [Allorhodopirellula heiligendammensis]TWU15851.1 hypothetical protein Poly21_30530 [Allorhodopirellula heiligendammensis]
MPTETFHHSALGEMTPALCSRLAELSHDPESKSKPDSLTSATRAVLIDIASLQVKANRTLGAPVQPEAAWWVTRQSLQQSTHHAVAALKATWLGAGLVVDLCCGLGSDLIAIARRGPALGVDIDSDVLAYAAANLKTAAVAAPLHSIDVTTAAVMRLLDGSTLIHVDPDRRVDGKRHTLASDLVPDWSRVTELLRSCRGGLVKLAPATGIPDDAVGKYHRTWIAAGGSVREQTVVAGDVLDHPWLQQHKMAVGGRSAISIRDGEASVFSFDQHLDFAIDSADGIGQWIIDPDPAIRAAGLTEAFAASTGTRPIGGPSGFLTCDDAAGLASWPQMANAAQVIDVIGCDDRKLRRWFRAHNGYPDLIKVRGGDMDPAALNRRMKSCGQTPMGLWIGRQGKRTYAAITQ